MNELALFAGAGGGILGGHLLGWRTVCAVEWEAYPASVLVARQNDKILPPFPIWDDVQTFDGKPWRGIIDVVSGGFPCQDISSAGKGVGITGARSSMWGHMARIIGEVRPKYAFVENSPMLATRGLGTVLRDLSEMGYDAEWCVLGANDVGARHQRERIWIVAKDTKQSRFFSHTEYNGLRWGKQQSESVKEKNGRHSIGELVDTNLCRCIHGQTEIDSTNGKFNAFGEFGSNSKNLADSSMSRLSSCNQSTFRSEQQVLEEQSWGSGYEYGNKDYWETEPNVGRVVDGMAGRVDRLKAIGNGQVPLCAATAWNILKGRIDKKTMIN
jgi:DNA (cytosine-5)-methyltransferase 1